MDRTPQRPVVLGTATAGLLLLLAAPSPAEALAALRDTGSAGDPTVPLVAAVALLAWGLALWLALTVLTTLAGRLPGLAGRAAAGVARRIAPATVRRAVEVALGLTVAVGVVGASPASAAATAPGPAAPPAVSLDWAAPPTALDRAAPPAVSLAGAAPPAPSPGLAPPALDDAAPAPAAPADHHRAAAAADLDWPAGGPTDDPAAVVPDATDDAPVVVQPGDTLWGLAEQALERDGRSATDAQVAQAWPSWWAANRDAVGDDPDLLQPGTRLSPPPDGADGAGPA